MPCRPAGLKAVETGTAPAAGRGPLGEAHDPIDRDEDGR